MSLKDLLFTASSGQQHSDHVPILTFPALAVKYFAQNSLHSTPLCPLVMTVTNVKVLPMKQSESKVITNKTLLMETYAFTRWRKTQSTGELAPVPWRMTVHTVTTN